MKKHILFYVALVMGTTLAIGATAATHKHKTKADHAALTPLDLQWMPVPPVLPKGVEIAVLRGNPFEEGIFTVRLRFPAGCTIPPHWHPTIESFTVLSGQMFVGAGNKIDKDSAKLVPTHGFSFLPALHHHYVYNEEETVIELTAYGPFQIYYVNPAGQPTELEGKYKTCHAT